MKPTIESVGIDLSSVDPKTRKAIENAFNLGYSMGKKDMLERVSDSHSSLLADILNETDKEAA